MGAAALLASSLSLWCRPCLRDIIRCHTCVLFIYRRMQQHCVTWWCNNGIACRISRLLVRLPPGALPVNNPGQIVCRHVPLFTKQYNLLPVKGRWRSAAGKVTVGLTSHWPCVTDSVVCPHTGSAAIESHLSTLCGKASFSIYQTLIGRITRLICLPDVCLSVCPTVRLAFASKSKTKRHKKPNFVLPFPNQRNLCVSLQFKRSKFKITRT